MVRRPLVGSGHCRTFQGRVPSTALLLGVALGLLLSVFNIRNISESLLSSSSSSSSTTTTSSSSTLTNTTIQVVVSPVALEHENENHGTNKISNQTILFPNKQLQLENISIAPSATISIPTNSNVVTTERTNNEENNGNDDEEERSSDRDVSNQIAERGPEPVCGFFPKNITRYEQLEHFNISAIPIPENLNIIFVGDSITRYQYMSLVYFLKFGHWINMKHPIPIPKNETMDHMYNQPHARDAVPDMGVIWKNFWNAKGDWYNYLASIMRPLEQCDCFDPNVVQWGRRFGVDDLENRFFRDPIRNNSVVYMNKFGDMNNYKIRMEFKTSWGMDQINSFRATTTAARSDIIDASSVAMRNDTRPGVVANHTDSIIPWETSINASKEALPRQSKSSPSDDTSMYRYKYKYRTTNWTNFITDFMSELKPKPNAFVFNQGLWNHDLFQQPRVYKDIIRAISDAGMVSIYKTTTKLSRDDDDDTAATATATANENAPYEQDLCQLADYCLDLSWTRHIPKYLYADRAHFYEPVYSWFNIALLDIVKSHAASTADSSGDI